MSRISMRMPIQHVRNNIIKSICCTKLPPSTLSCFEPDADKDTKRIGTFDPICRVKSVIMEAFQNAAFLCEEYYECAPDIEIEGSLTASCIQ